MMNPLVFIAITIPIGWYVWGRIGSLDKILLNPLLTKACDLLKNNDIIKTIFIMHGVSILLQFMESYTYSLINEDIELCLLVYGVSCIIHKSYKKWYLHPKNAKLFSTKIKPCFYRWALCKYNEFSFLTKNKNTFTSYNSKFDSACLSINMVIDWGIPSIINSFTMILSLIFITISYGMTTFVFIFITFDICFYTYIIRGFFKKFVQEKKQYKKTKQSIVEKRTLMYPLFQTRDITINQMTDSSNKENDINIIIENGWTTINQRVCIAQILNLVFVLLFLHYTVSPNKMMILSLFNKMESSLVQLMHFMNQFERFDSNYDMFHKVLEEAEYDEFPPQHNMPKNMIINKVDVNLGNYSLISLLSEKLIINQGEKILLKGKSGSGKTTFINALVGLINGIELDGHSQPHNLYSNYVLMYQGIRSATPTSQVSILDLFTGGDCVKFNKEAYQKACEICCIWDWVSSRELEAAVNEEISGGQKSRLILAIKIYILIRDDKNVLVLDEPEQGSDPEIAYELLNNILTEFPTKTIFVASHLEQIETIYQWSQKISITKIKNKSILEKLK